MGEYAKYLGQSVKIGTCEDMYYLRAEHRASVTPERGSVDVTGAEATGCRFRFPWPDEDEIARPGHDNADHAYDRGVFIPGAASNPNVEHYSVQFTARPGYLLSIPCPEGQPDVTPGFSTVVNGLKVARNGFAGAVHLCQQKLLADGRLVPVMRCGGCGAKWRLEDAAEIEALVVTIRAEADRRSIAKEDHAAHWWHTVADRVADGAGLHAVAV